MTKRQIFEALAALPPEHSYWQNKWRFTRPVFTNESRQGNDETGFWLWAQEMPKGLRDYIHTAPDVKANGSRKTAS